MSAIEALEAVIADLCAARDIMKESDAHALRLGFINEQIRTVAGRASSLREYVAAMRD